MIDKKIFLLNATKTLEDMYDLVLNIPNIKMSDINYNNSALIIMDMVNGFANEGILSSQRVKALIPEITRFAKKSDVLGMQKIVFADSHTKDCPEFDAYPPHCIKGTNESEVVEEIKEIGKYLLITKNSTNGFLEEDFQMWLDENPRIDTFIVTGDCTDICIVQFVVTLKAWFNNNNKKVRVIVPLNMVDTYDLDIHNGDFINIVTAYNMLNNGIEVVNSIE